jgi:hypothetical protein
MDVDVAELPAVTDDGPPNIPVAWKPTGAEPVPVVRCVTIKRDGERCRRWSLRGTTVCVKHGGQLKDVKQHAEAVVEGARLRLVGLSDDAIDVIEQLLDPQTSAQVRLKAATEVLDRAGVRGGVDIHQETQVTVNPSELLDQRLAQLRRRGAEARERLSEVFGDDVVEGEVVSDEPTEADVAPAVDQPSLFDM